MTDDDELPLTMSFNELQSGIECLEASELVTVERNEVNGYINFRFYDTTGDIVGKMTFDEIEDDMVERTKAVIDHVASTDSTILYQNEVESIWDAYDPGAAPAAIA